MLDDFRRGLLVAPKGEMPPGGKELSTEISGKALRVEGNPLKLSRPELVVASDEGAKGEALTRALGFDARIISSADELESYREHEKDNILAVFSSIRAYKGGTESWLRHAEQKLSPRVAVAFGPSALIDGSDADLKITAWWGAEEAQEAVGKIIADLIS
jgi:hypothetical protein